MPISPADATVCDQCGHPLEPGNAHLGCLHCLLGETTEDGARGPTAARQPDWIEGGARYDHYEILRREDGAPFELGRGGMGVTYKAVDVNLRVPVALKVIDAGYATHPRARDLFLREARNAARLRHPNVATVYHFGTRDRVPAEAGLLADDEAASTACFYAMEFVDGETLDACVRRSGRCRRVWCSKSASRSGAPSWRRRSAGWCIAISNPATSCSRAARRRGRTRREQSWVKVIDFGLAKVIRNAALEEDGADADTGGPLTHGAFVGTPGFASPEQYELAELDVALGRVFARGDAVVRAHGRDALRRGDARGGPRPAGASTAAHGAVD